MKFDLSTKIDAGVHPKVPANKCLDTWLPIQILL